MDEVLFLYQSHRRRLPKEIVHMAIYKSWNRSVSGVTSSPGSPHVQTITNDRKLGGAWDCEQNCNTDDGDLHGTIQYAPIITYSSEQCDVFYLNNYSLDHSNITLMFFYLDNYITYSSDHSEQCDVCFFIPIP